MLLPGEGQWGGVHPRLLGFRAQPLSREPLIIEPPDSIGRARKPVDVFVSSTEASIYCMSLGRED